MNSRREKQLQQEVEQLRKRLEKLEAGADTGRGGEARHVWYEYKSEATFLGLPLVHVCRGRHPQTGKRGIAKGIVAIGEIAVGVVSIGSLCFGGICIGAIGAGIIAFGGIGIGIIAALGGVAIGGMAAGGLAIGGLAMGGVGVGYIAIAGNATGVYALGDVCESSRPFWQVFEDPTVPAFVKAMLRRVSEYL